MTMKEPTIKINSFYYSSEENHLIFVLKVDEGCVHYQFCNLWDMYTIYMNINEFLKYYKRVGWLEE